MKFFVFALTLLASGQTFALDVTMEIASDGTEKPTITGTTNLPNGIELLVTLRGKESNYFAQDKTIVENGHFQVGPFSLQGTPLNEGAYLVETTMPLAELQPRQTWSIIGASGKNLQGPLVKESILGGKTIEHEASFIVESASAKKSP